MEAIGKKTDYFISPAAPEKEEKDALIDDLRKNFETKSYDELKQIVKDNLQGLATHRDYFSNLISSFFHIDLPKSMQAAMVLLAAKKMNLTNYADVQSWHVKDVVRDLLLTADGSRYDTTNDSSDNYKHQIIATIAYSKYDQSYLHHHVNAGISLLKSLPLQFINDHAIDWLSSLSGENFHNIANQLLCMEDDCREIEGANLKITESGEKKSNKKLQVTDGDTENETIESKNLKELREDLYLCLYMKLKTDPASIPDHMKRLYQQITVKRKEDDARRKTRLEDNIAAYNRGDPGIERVSVKVVQDPSLRYSVRDRHYSETPGWDILQYQFDRCREHNKNADEGKKIQNPISFTVENTDFKYNGPEGHDAKLVAHIPMDKMDDCFKKCQWLVKTKQVVDIKLYFNDPDDDKTYKEGQCSVLFYVSNFYDKGELERVRDLMVAHEFISSDHETPICKTQYLGEVACRFPDLKVTDQKFEQFGKIAYINNRFNEI